MREQIAVSRRPLFDAVVVGAGVVGSAAALSLAREGLRVAIVEAHAPSAWRADRPDLRVYAFAPDSRALLQSLGVWADVAAARVQPYRRMWVWDAAGGGELSFEADAFGVETLGHIVEHGLLVDRLWAAMARETGIERYCPDKLRGIEQDPHRVVVELEGGASLRARLLLGADGAASRVRNLAGLTVSEHDYRQRALVAYVRTQAPHEETCWQRFLPGGPLAFLPCSGDSADRDDQRRSSIVWSLPNDEAERLLALDENGFCRELTRAFDARLGEVSEVSERIAFPLRRRLASDMRVGRIALIGDAAHTVHPLAGQGVNLGLRDVASLCATLRSATPVDGDIAAGDRLQRWAHQCRSDNAVSAYSYETINAVFSNSALLPTLLRGHALGLVGRLPPLTRFLWKQAAGLS